VIRDGTPLIRQERRPLLLPGCRPSRGGTAPADLNGLTGNTTSGRFDVIPESILENSSPEDFTFLGPELEHGPHLLKSGRFKVMGKRAQLLKTELVKSFGEIPARKTSSTRTTSS
jgi:hypothetical protein